jgi:hypothetical protein
MDLMEAMWKWLRTIIGILVRCVVWITIVIKCLWSELICLACLRTFHRLVTSSSLLFSLMKLRSLA